MANQIPSKVRGLILVAALTLFSSIADAQPAPATPSALPAAAFEAFIAKSADRVEAANATAPLRGTGRYPAMMEVDLAKPNATLFHPFDLAHLRRKLGVLIWGNGGCSDDGASAMEHLAEIASHGYLVVAPGRPLTGPLVLPGAPSPAPMRTTVDDLRGNLEWVIAENGRPGSPYFGKIDTAAIAVAGHSCGGMQAIILAQDPRIKTVIIHNSGIFPVLPDNPPLLMHRERLQGIHTPILFIVGGKSDIASKFAHDTFNGLPSVPAMLISKELGHEGTFKEPHGGEVAQIAADWLDWKLGRNSTAQNRFQGKQCQLCNEPSWTIERKGAW